MVPHDCLQISQKGDRIHLERGVDNCHPSLDMTVELYIDGHAVADLVVKDV